MKPDDGLSRHEERGGAGEKAEYDFVVVGSGAGGGPLAANLALAGFKVLLLEAGGREKKFTYSVPGYSGLATEDEAYRWDYFVRHYGDQRTQESDPKFVAKENGILYPRAGTLGGCTAHNAMLTAYPADSDWDYIAEITGDASWAAASMRQYFTKLERCRYLPAPDAVAAGHGVDGWLTTEKPDTSGAPPDEQLYATVLYSVYNSGHLAIDPNLDPNAAQVAEQRAEGYLTVAQATDKHSRSGPRDLILKVEQECPERLVVETEAFATRILFDDDDSTAARGVEYCKGAHLYAADPNASSEGAVASKKQRRRVVVTHDVILCCGAFNTPQLLMLSGIGPAAELKKHGIHVRVDLPGVGQNLQDRYEVPIISEMVGPWVSIAECTFSGDPLTDPCLKEWEDGYPGPYNSSGAVFAYQVRSFPEMKDPDLFVFALAGRFEGYFPKWFSTNKDIRNQCTWLALKAHTRNTGGTVTLKSNDPFDRPEINFHYFDEGTDKGGQDLREVVQGIKFARRLMNGSPYVTREILPGPEVESDEQLAEFVKRHAWGHHCSCSCPIGADNDPKAVLDSRFRVRNTKNLRVVDASVFPRIPGMFIVLPIYMISEKAAVVIAHDAEARRRPRD